MEEQPKENKPEYGENSENFKTILKVIVARHGPKLSATGEKNELSSNFIEAVTGGYQKMDIPSDVPVRIHTASSPESRAKESAKVIKGEMDQTLAGGKNTVIREELATPFTDDSPDLKKIVEMQRAIEADAVQAVNQKYPEWPEEKKQEEIRNRIDTDVMTTLLDEEYVLSVSMNRLADMLGKRYAGFLKHLEMLAMPQGTSEPLAQIDVTHSFQIIAFLKKYLVFDDGISADTMGGKEFFEKIGGMIPESQSIEIEYQVDEAGKPRMIVSGEFAKGKPFSGAINTETLSQL